MLEQLITSCRGRVVDLRPLSARRPRCRSKPVVQAMTSGAEVIIDGLLPVDFAVTGSARPTC